MSREPDRQPRDAGMTLVEVLVASGLFGLLTTMIATVAIIGMRTASGLQVRLDNSSQANLGLAAAGTLLRSAAPVDGVMIIDATSTCVTFYAELRDDGPRKLIVRYDAADSALEQTTLPTATAGDCDTAPSGAPAVRTLARGLDVPAGGIFRYFSFAGARTSGPPVPGDELGTIATIDVVLSIQTVPGRGDDTSAEMEQRIRLPNAREET
ncbi:type II secretion system protein [Nocardioides sp. YIM 152315]|uniref:PulJ/GspJ family protein n=1 Tax=Nocardioides sp. YIM 152315 TaxID=3031760 RepID=UPI0023D9BF53|nr:type II secretion system protein [Nocardioides sp. YIM 152315]MDF1603495.1 type II secretion system protein [Nocardioides sp. YIM 152315]